jgi:hypothetical protein
LGHGHSATNYGIARLCLICLSHCVARRGVESVPVVPKDSKALTV